MWLACAGNTELINNINEFTTKFLVRDVPLDYLVLSQGIATIQGYTPTGKPCGSQVV